MYKALFQEFSFPLWYLIDMFMLSNYFMHIEMFFGSVYIANIIL